MERLNIHLTRATSAEYDDLQSAVGANPAVTYDEIAALGLTAAQREVLERPYSDTVNADADMENVVSVVLEGYTISGVCNAQGTPVQPYLTVNFSKFEGSGSQARVHTATDTEGEHKKAKGSSGAVLMCEAAPYTAVRYERPVVLTEGLLRSVTDMKVNVYGPLGQAPLFTTLTLHLALTLNRDIKKANRAARSVVAHVDGVYGAVDDLPHYRRGRR